MFTENPKPYTFNIVSVLFLFSDTISKLSLSSPKERTLKCKYFKTFVFNLLKGLKKGYF